MRRENCAIYLVIVDLLWGRCHVPQNVFLVYVWYSYSSLFYASD